MCTVKDLKRMLKELKVPLAGMTTKVHYVSRLLESGWIMAWHGDAFDTSADDVDDVLPEDDVEQVEVVSNDRQQANDKDGIDEDEESGNEDEESESGSESEDEVDLEEHAFRTLPSSATNYQDLIPAGWVSNLGERMTNPKLGSRVLIYCWDEWSCGVVTKVFERQHRRPACQISSGRATVCVHWPAERNDDGEVMHTYLHLTKNNTYGGGRSPTEGNWLALSPIK
eukprot:COSAG02_NODE_1864_length_10606_cov_17.350148_5_plen_226_part_00